MTDARFARPTNAERAAEAQSRVCWSRSGGLLSQAGSADAELKTRVSDEAADEFRKLARSFGMNTSEMLRLLVLTRLYGVNGVTMMTSEQLAQVAGVGPEKARA